MPTYAADGKTAWQPRLTDLGLQNPRASPACVAAPPPTPPNAHGTGCPWGRRSNEFISGCWQGAPTWGNSIGRAGRGGVNNSGTPLAYTALRKDEASLHRHQPPHALAFGVKMGSRGTITRKPSAAWESHQLAKPCHPGRSQRALPALATSGSGAPTGYTAPLVPLAHSSLCPAGKEKPPGGGSCALHQPGFPKLKAEEDGG